MGATRSDTKEIGGKSGNAGCGLTSSTVLSDIIPTVSTVSAIFSQRCSPCGTFNDIPKRHTRLKKAILPQVKFSPSCREILSWVLQSGRSLFLRVLSHGSNGTGNSVRSHNGALSPLSFGRLSTEKKNGVLWHKELDPCRSDGCARIPTLSQASQN